MTSTETRILYGTYGIYRPVCYRTHIFSVMGQACHMLHMGLIRTGVMMNNNQELPLDGSYKRYDRTDYDLCHTLFATSYKEWNYKWIQVDTIYNLITVFLICHIIHIRNGDIYMGLNIYRVSLYEKNTNFNYYAYHPST